LIEPAYPFIYIPETDFRNIMSLLTTDTLPKYKNFVVLSNLMGGKFTQKCSDIDFGDVNTTLAFTPQINATDTNGESTLQHLQNDLLIDGAIFGDPDSCYLGIFKNTGAHNASDTVYLGTIFLQKYYTFFDMSECDNNTCSKLYVGSGLRNMSANILQPLYNDSAPMYNSTMEVKQRITDQSYWTYQPNDFTKVAQQKKADDEKKKQEE